MSKNTAVVKHEGDWWIGWIEEVPGINCQGPTREELMDTLRVTLAEARNMRSAIRDRQLLVQRRSG